MLGSSVLIALVLAMAVYIFDRDWSTVRFLAPLSAFQPGIGGWFGSLGNTLPSFLHAYAFALLVILALRPYRHATTVGALGWLTVAGSQQAVEVRHCADRAVGVVVPATQVQHSRIGPVDQWCRHLSR